jgi:hypothetical protein
VGVGTDEIHELDKSDLVELIELLNEAIKEMANSVIEELPLEIAIIKWCGEEADLGQSQPVKDDANRDSSRETTSADHDLTQTITPDVHSQPTVESGISPSLEMKDSVNDDVWKSILAFVKPINASVEALLRSAKPVGYDGKILTLAVYYKFHKERLEDTHHRKIVEDIVAKVLKSPTRVCCVLVEPPPRKIIEEAKIETVLTEGNDHDIIEAAEKIFSN